MTSMYYMYVVSCNHSEVITIWRVTKQADCSHSYPTEYVICYMYMSKY